MNLPRTSSERKPPSIWLWAFGYFACYAPYSALTKALSSGKIDDHVVSGFEILPLSTLASLFGMWVFIVATGYWRAASQWTLGGLTLPRPTWWTFLSGVCTAAIIATTTLSYSFPGTSIVFMMLLMRGGVLVLAPIVDSISARKVRWTSWVALSLSLAAVWVASSQRDDLVLTLSAAIDVAIYLAAYFVRLRFMSKLAKGSPEANLRYFVEEQLIATPTIVLVICAAAAFGDGVLFEELRRGFTSLALSDIGLVALIGFLSQGTGIFGALILLDPRENSFSIPVNRASSILAGVLASAALWFLWNGNPISTRELIGAGLVCLAIVVLSLPRAKEAT